MVVIVFKICHSKWMKIYLGIVTFFLATVVYGAGPEVHVSASNKVFYSLDWWVAGDGQVTKIYKINYEGPRVLSLLEQFSQGNKLKFVRSLIPYVESLDQLIEEKQSDVSSFVFIFKSKPQYVGEDAKLALRLSLPVYEDPVASYLESKNQSRIFYQTHQITISNRVAYRTPYPLDYFSSSFQSYSLNGVGVSKSFQLLKSPNSEFKLPGFDQPGAEVTQVIEVPESEIETKELPPQAILGNQSLTMARSNTEVLFQIPRTSSGHPQVSPYQWGGSLGYYGVGTLSSYGGYGYSGSQIDINFFMSRQFSQYFYFHPFQLHFSNMNGGYNSRPFYFTKSDLGPTLDLQMPLVTPGKNKFLAFADLEFHPSYGFLNSGISGMDNGRAYTAIESRAKLGVSLPETVFILSFSIDFYQTTYSGIDALKSDTGVIGVISW